MDTVRLNIALLPDKKVRTTAMEMSRKIARSVRTEFVLDYKQFYPHNTVYQIAVPEKNFQKIKDSVRTITGMTQPFPVATSLFRVWFGTFVSWDIILSKQLANLQQEIIENTNHFREGLSMVDPSLLSILSRNDQSDAKHYGSLLIGPNYKPHITITRLVNINDAQKTEKILEKKRVMHWTADGIAIGSCGLNGTFNSILATFPFSR